MKNPFKSVLGVALLFACFSANAIFLPPGGFPVALPSEPDPVGGTVLATSTQPFSSSVFGGTLASSVISGDAGNPWGGLTFTYQVHLTSAVQAISRFTVSPYGHFLTDVSFSGAPMLNTGVERSIEPSGTGDVIRFSFPGLGLQAGMSTALLVVQTDAHLWQFGQGAVIDGQSANVLAYAPAVVPEPTTLGLFLAAIGLAALSRRP